MLSPDFEAIAQVRMAAWEREVQRQQIRAQVARPRPPWRRWAGGGLRRVGSWLTHLGVQLEAEPSPL